MMKQLSYLSLSNSSAINLQYHYHLLLYFGVAAQIVLMNKEEATLVTKIHLRQDTKEQKFSKEIIFPLLHILAAILKTLTYGRVNL